MGLVKFLDGNNQVLDDNGAVLSSGTLTFYVAGSGSTKKDTYPTAADASAGTNPNPNPITLGADGRPQNGGNEIVIWLNGDYDVTVKDSLGATVRTESGLNPEAANSDSNLSLKNPSFEDVLDDTWQVTGTYTHITGSSANHGSKALRLSAGATAVSYWSGGGSLIPHSPDEDIVGEFSLLCLNATDLAKVVIHQHGHDYADLAADLDLFNSSSGNPTAGAELKTGRIAASSLSANCRYISVELVGGTAANTWALFDGLRIGAPGSIFGSITAKGSISAESGVVLGSDKGSTFTPSGSGSTVVGGFRVAGAYQATTGGTTSAMQKGIFATFSNPGGVGTQRITFNRSLASPYLVLVFPHGATFASWQPVLGDTIDIYTYNAAGAATSGSYGLLILEMDS